MVRVGRGQVNARKITASGSLAHLRLSADTAEEVLYLSFPNLSLLVTCSALSCKRQSFNRKDSLVQAQKIFFD